MKWKELDIILLKIENEKKILRTPLLENIGMYTSRSHISNMITHHGEKKLTGGLLKKFKIALPKYFGSMEDESEHKEQKTHGGEGGMDAMMESIRNLSRTTVFLAEANRDQTILLKVHPNSGVSLDYRSEVEISNRIVRQLASELAGKALWKTESEGLTILSKLLTASLLGVKG